jgi:hypothetical protein
MMPDVEIMVDVRDGSDPELSTFLAAQGIRSRPHYGINNGSTPDGSASREIFAHAAPYVLITATAQILIAAVKAYAQSKQKRIIVQRLKTGTKIDATNWTAEELRELGIFDVIKLESSDSKKTDTKPKS